MPDSGVGVAVISGILSSMAGGARVVVLWTTRRGGAWQRCLGRACRGVVREAGRVVSFQAHTGRGVGGSWRGCTMDMGTHAGGKGGLVDVVV